jgi:UTP-glucose-1-phosphate uridylyltransferase/mevalonate kinase
MELFVPGRICLFGEHSDWAGGYRRSSPELEKGYTLICGTSHGLYARVERSPSALALRASGPNGAHYGPHAIPMQPEALLQTARSGSFWSYAAGVAYHALLHYQVGGLTVDNYKTDLPMRKGLSSSAAICVLIARAFNRLYDLKLTVRGEMELAYQGEILTGSQCGRMDQGCAFGQQPVLMTFDGDLLETQEVRAGAPLHFVIVDLQTHKDTRKILAALNRCYPHARDETGRGVQELLGPSNREIMQAAVQALEVGDGPRLGALMNEAQARFDRWAAPACPEELEAPALHRVLSWPSLQEHIWGGKGVGSQGDGSAQLLARSRQDQQAVVRIIQEELGLPSLELTIQPGQPVRKAVIPAAGLDTRLFPASKGFKKEFFPIVGRDGIARPALLVLVEEALEAGVEEVIIITPAADQGAFEDFFHTPTPPETFARLPEEAQVYARRLVEIGQKVSFVVQPQPQGVGDAVLCAREAVGQEPFLLMLSSHLYLSNAPESCTRQLLAAFHQYGPNLVGLQVTPEGGLGRFDAVRGSWEIQPSLLRVEHLAERASPAQARQSLRQEGLAQGEYLTLIGLYVLDAQVFTVLAEQAQTGAAAGKLGLTQALDRLGREQGVYGLVIQGQRGDIGLPGPYAETQGAIWGSNV